MVELSIILFTATLVALLFFKAFPVNQEVMIDRVFSFAKVGDIKGIRRAIPFLNSEILNLALVRACRYQSLNAIVILQGLGADFRYTSVTHPTNALDIALNNQSWDMATRIISCSESLEVPFSYFEYIFVEAHIHSQYKRAMVIFCALPSNFRAEMIREHFSKICYCCRKTSEYDREFGRVATELKVFNLAEFLWRDGHIALFYASRNQSNLALKMLNLYYKRDDIRHQRLLHCLNYWMGLVYLELGNLESALSKFESTETFMPNYLDTRSYISKITEKQKNQQTRNRQSNDSYRQQAEDRRRNEQYQRQQDKQQEYQQRSEDRQRSRNSDGSKFSRHYKILEITAIATKVEIKKAYYKKMSQYHPDKVANQGKDVEAKATEMAKKINEAYEVCFPLGK